MKRPNFVINFTTFNYRALFKFSLSHCLYTQNGLNLFFLTAQNKLAKKENVANSLFVSIIFVPLSHQEL